MADGNVSSIDIQGIVRNRTKIGVEDGQAEDLINLRFVNGSWRASGDGRLIDFTMGREYSQLYIHTNIYRHLLGVYDGTLYWFANIAEDGVTFTPLDTPVALTTVQGDIWITQRGHLLTVIDDSDDFEHLVYKTGEYKYIEVYMDVNGKPADRSLCPFGQIHFNLYEPTLLEEKNSFKMGFTNGTYRKFETDHFVKLMMDDVDLQHLDTSIERYLSSIGVISDLTPSEAFMEYYPQRVLSYLKTVQNEADKKNIFTRPFMVVCALKLYDGSYVFASLPVILIPRETPTYDREHFTLNYAVAKIENPSDAADFDAEGLDENGRKKYTKTDSESFEYVPNTSYNGATGDRPNGRDSYFLDNVIGVGRSIHGYIGTDIVPAFSNGFSSSSNNDRYQAAGSDIVVSISTLSKIDNTIFTHIAIFVTRQAEIYNFIDEGKLVNKYRSDDSVIISGYYSYQPERKTAHEIIDELTKSPFYLLHEQKLETAEDGVLHITPTMIGKGVLANIVQQNRLTTEAFARTTYLPKVSYMYNGRLHIANYKSYPFFGYPIDIFHLHNHSVKVQADSWFKGVLPNLTGNNDDYLQYVKAQKAITNYADLVTAEAPYFLVKVYIDSLQGEQVVCRYIPAYNPSPAENGRADFIEDLNPLLTYPDARAKKMEIYYVNSYTTGSILPGMDGVYVKWQDFQLKPHPYLNMAYYIDPDLKPIKLADFKNLRETQPLAVE